MHIVFMFTYGYSLKTWFESGTIQKEIEIYRQLTQYHGFKVTLVTYGDDSDLEFQHLLNEVKIVPIYEYFKYSEYAFIRYIKSFFIPFIVKNRVHDVDLIKQNQLMGSWISIIYKFLIKKPLIVRTGYDMLFFSQKERKGLLKNFLYKSLTTLSLRFSNMYTVTSFADKSFLEGKFGHNIDIKIRPNWIYANTSSLTKKRYKNRILCVGRLETQKNYLNLIRNVENSDYQLDIVGTGSLRSEIVNLALDLDVKIDLLGSISNKELLNKYEEYRYFVLASYFEGNPKVVLEAMSKGCIPILSNIPNHIELVEHNINGIIFDPLKMNMTEYLDILNSDDILSEKLSLNSANKVKENNSLETAIKNDLLDYEKLKLSTK